MKNKTNKLITLIICLILFLILLGVGIRENFFSRVYREIEYGITDKISVNEGYYIGDVDFGIIEGSGKIVFNNDDIYEGNFHDNKYNGLGTYIWANASKYYGCFVNNIFQGSGTLTFSNGDVFDGTFEENSFKNGKMVFKDFGIYEGDFRDGERNGKGDFYWETKDQYNGIWKDDAIAGKGTLIFFDGKKLEGEFKDGKLYNGNYSVTTDKAKYVINIVNGIVKSANIDFSNGTKYSGHYKNNMFNGKGKLSYPNGDVYEGNFENNIKSGDGTYRWKDGSQYIGNWQNDKINGNGTYIYANIKNAFKLTGTFKDNKPDGICKYYINATKSYRTEWKDGTCIKLME